MLEKKTVYMFDKQGAFLKKFYSLTSAANYVRKNKSVISKAIERGSIVNREHYFSFNIDFEVPVKKSNHNPLLHKPATVYLHYTKVSREEKKAALELLRYLKANKHLREFTISFKNDNDAIIHPTHHDGLVMDIILT